jgi:hypothetical protein
LADTNRIAKVLSPTWGAKTETATRLRGPSEGIPDWATVQEAARLL